MTPKVDPFPLAPPKFELPKFVQDRDGTTTGRVVGAGRLCKLHGCGGWMIPVRWPCGHLTNPCSKGMTSTDSKDTWRIQ